MVSKAQKLNIVALSSYAEWLNKPINEIQDKVVRKYLKTAQTYLFKAFNYQINSFDKSEKWSEVQSILRLARDFDIELVPQITGYKLNNNDIYLLADIARINTCLTCETSEGGVCELKNILQTLNIKGDNEDGCPYNVWEGTI
mgnify:CR=1 FL=1|jgi:hypothetical protein